MQRRKVIVVCCCISKVNFYLLTIYYKIDYATICQTLLQMYNTQNELRQKSKFWDCIRKICLCRENGIILCHRSSSNGILYPFEGIGTSDAGKWKNCNTFLSFCPAILSQIRSRGVASVLCNTMRCIGLLGKADAPLHKIKKAYNKAVFPCHLSRHINISDKITPG